MHEKERIAIEPCGCRVDKATGLTTHFCAKHDTQKEKDLETEIERVTQEHDEALSEAERLRKAVKYARTQFNVLREWKCVDVMDKALRQASEQE